MKKTSQGADVHVIRGMKQRLQIPNMYEEWCIHNATILMVVTMNEEKKYQVLEYIQGELQEALLRL